MGGNLWLQLFLLANVFAIGVVATIAVMHWRAHRRPDQDEQKARKIAMPLLPLDVRQRIIEEAESDYEKVLRRSAVQFEKGLNETASRLSGQLSKIGTSILDDEMSRYRTSLADIRESTEKQLGSATSEIEAHQGELRRQLQSKQAEIEAKLVEHRNELEERLAERNAELEQTFADIQARYHTQQVELEAELARRETELGASLKDREQKIAHHQASLEMSLMQRQQEYAAKQLALEGQLETEMAKRREMYTSQLNTKLSDAVTAFLIETLGNNVDLGAQTPYLIAELEAHKDELVREITQ